MVATYCIILLKLNKNAVNSQMSKDLQAISSITKYMEAPSCSIMLLSHLKSFKNMLSQNLIKWNFY